MNEFLSFYENSITTKPQLYYYQSSKKSHIPFILEWKNKKELIALSCINSEVIKKSDFGSFSSFNKKINPTTYSSYRQIILTQSLESYQENDLEIHPLRG